MKNLFIPYELAVKLKNKGLRLYCMAYFDIEDNNKLKPIPMSQEINQVDSNSNNLMVAAPIYQEVIDWLRSKHNIFAFIKTDIIHGSEIHTGVILGKTKPIEVFCESEDYYNTYNKLIEESLTLI